MSHPSCFIVELFNRSPCTRLFSATFKKPTNASLCPPISNSHNNNNNNPICKAPECQKTSVALAYSLEVPGTPCCSLLMEYLSLADLLLPLQSGFRQGRPPRLPSCECSRIFSRLSTAVTSTVHFAVLALQLIKSGTLSL